MILLSALVTRHALKCSIYTSASLYFPIIVWTFTISFVVQSDSVFSTTICLKEFCIYDRFLFPLLSIFFLDLLHLLVEFSGLELISWWRWGQTLDFWNHMTPFSDLVWFVFLRVPTFLFSVYIFTATQPSAGISTYLTILVIKILSLSLSQLRASSYLQSWDPPIPHICLLLECHLPFFFTCSFKVRTFFSISVNSQHWITVVSAKSATSSLQPLARPFANVGYHSLWVYSGNFPSLWEMNIYSYFVSHLLWGYLSNYFILSHLLVFTSLQWEVFLTSFCKC